MFDIRYTKSRAIGDGFGSKAYKVFVYETEQAPWG